MKNKIKNLLTVVILTFVPILTTLAQPLPPAPSPGTNAGAPIFTCNTPVGNGYWILLALAFSYGVYKIWQIRKAEKNA